MPKLLPLVVALALSLSASACLLEQPGVGEAADPSKAKGPAPWRSATSNAELQKKLLLLEDILDGKLTAAEIPARVEREWPSASADERAATLSSVTALMNDLQAAGKAGQKITGPDRDMAIAQLYFSERRFIEAAQVLSKLLDKDPIYPGARNLLARCFFFLQNRDRTIDELEYILKNPEQQKNRDEVLDALFMMGAAVAETPGMSRENLEKGKNAWETYLKLSPESPQRPVVEKGLKDIEDGLRGEGRLAQPLVPRNSEASGDDTVDPRGGRRTGGGGGGQDAPEAAARRVDQLDDTAAPRDRALAEGLDALDAKDLATAEEKLKTVTAAGAPFDQAAREALVGLGRVFVQTGRIPDALRTFGEVIKQDPDYMPAWHYNGMAHMMSGSPAEAVKSWQKILDKDPAYAARFNLDKRIEVARRMAK